MENITLWCGDCLEKMQDIPSHSIDFILCDLPYGTTKCPWDIVIPFNDFINNFGTIVFEDDFMFQCYQNGVPYDKACAVWNERKQSGLWSHYNRIIKENGAIALFGQEPFSTLIRNSNRNDYKFDWYWEKERLTNIAQVKRRAGKTVETISMFYKKQPVYNPQMEKYDGPKRTNKVKNGKLGKLVDDNTKKVKEYVDTGWRYPTQVLRFQRDCLKSNLHPTQKPVALLEYLIRTYTNEEDTVFDNCMGSGSCGVACLNTNRKFIGIEYDEHYFEVAKNRIEICNDNRELKGNKNE